MAMRRILAGGVFSALTFLFVYGNGVFFSNAVPESHFLGWAAGQGVRLLNIPGEKFRQQTVSGDAVWNQSYNTKVRYWIGGGLVLFLAAGCLAAGGHALLPQLRLPRARPAGEARDAGAAPGAPAGEVSRLAIGSFVVALLGGFAFGHILGYGAVILGWAALFEMERRPWLVGRKLAWAGAVIGAAVLLVWVVTLQIQPPLHAFEG